MEFQGVVFAMKKAFDMGDSLASKEVTHQRQTEQGGVRLGLVVVSVILVLLAFSTYTVALSFRCTID